MKISENQNLFVPRQFESLERRGNDVLRKTTLKDGRILTYFEVGHPNGYAILFFPGTPSSVDPRLTARFLFDRNLRFVYVNRPGIDGSTPNPGRTVTSFASDVDELVDDLELTNYSIIGRSGGGAHALACAGKKHELETRKNPPQKVLLLGSTVPPDFEIDWTSDMGTTNRDVYNADIAKRRKEIERRAEIIRDDPHDFLHLISSDMGERDREITNRWYVRQMLETGWFNAVRDGDEGFWEDSYALSQPWGFRARDFDTTRTHVEFYHGTSDVFSPFPQLKRFAAHIIGAQMTEARDKGHFDYIIELPNLLNSRFNSFARLDFPKRGENLPYGTSEDRISELYIAD
jgi:pimeloyl-ACP methyl ester carboxylesterase